MSIKALNALTPRSLAFVVTATAVDLSPLFTPAAAAQTAASLP
jgi:hypothetical protein